MRSFLDFLIGRKTAKAEPNGRLGLFGVESHGAQVTVSNPWWGHDPSDKQLKALWVYEECPDLFYGAAGPGKTSYLLMAAVQYVQYPHYRALLLRKTYADLSLPDAIMDRAISWWDGVEGARFSHADKTCYFPSGARVQFGYMASARDHLRCFQIAPQSCAH